MKVLDSARIGSVRLRLVRMKDPPNSVDLTARHYIIGENITEPLIAVIADVGYYEFRARQTLQEYVEREQARLAAEQDDGL